MHQVRSLATGRVARPSLAWRAAKGGLALAHDFAVGGSAFGSHANDPAAKEFIENSPFFRNVEPALANMQQFHESGWSEVIVVAVIIILTIGSVLAAYRRKRLS